VAAKGASDLTRILKLTAKLLFEKGVKLSAVQRLLSSFVQPAMVRNWYIRHCEVHGINHVQQSGGVRMPYPPIDFAAVSIEELERLLDRAPGAHQGGVNASQGTDG
jgi:hypothetical protein